MLSVILGTLKEGRREEKDERRDKSGREEERRKEGTQLLSGQRVFRFIYT